jgi:hypothetical protein
MPGFGGKKTDANQLSNSQIALLANYLLQHYGRDQTVSENDVATVRQGGPSSPLLLLARLGVAAAAVAFVLLVSLILWKRRRGRNAAS